MGVAVKPAKPPTIQRVQRRDGKKNAKGISQQMRGARHGRLKHFRADAEPCARCLNTDAIQRIVASNGHLSELSRIFAESSTRRERALTPLSACETLRSAHCSPTDMIGTATQST
jgi:hypothetical protein